MKAIGNLLFAAILFLAVFFTAGLSAVLHIFKDIIPLQMTRKPFIFRRK
jgi:hypothetical protein